jgi:hypothetical protein
MNRAYAFQKAPRCSATSKRTRERCKHAEVLADRDERRMLVVQAHSQTAINALRDLGDGTRGGLVDFFGRDQRHSGHERFDALAAVFALFGLFALFEYALGDDFVAPGHHLADVGKGNRRQLPQDALEANFGPLRSAPDDLLNSCRNPFISFQPAGIAVVGFVARQDIGLAGTFALGEGLCEALMTLIGKRSHRSSMPSRLRAQHSARLAKKLPQETALLHGLFRVEPVLEHSVAFAPWSATARSVEAANRPASDSRGFTPFARALRGCYPRFYSFDHRQQEIQPSLVELSDSAPNIEELAENTVQKVQVSRAERLHEKDVGMHLRHAVLLRDFHTQHG